MLLEMLFFTLAQDKKAICVKSYWFVLLSAALGTIKWCNNKRVLSMMALLLNNTPEPWFHIYFTGQIHKIKWKYYLSVNCQIQTDGLNTSVVSSTIQNSLFSGIEKQLYEMNHT